jgi:probable addiction module antidote protein
MEKNVKIRQWDVAEFLDNQADIDAYLQVAFESGDPHQITKALGNAAKAKSMLEVANNTGLTREHLYTSLSESGNPTLLTLTKIMDALGYQLSFVPKPNRKRAI